MLTTEFHFKAVHNTKISKLRVRIYLEMKMATMTFLCSPGVSGFGEILTNKFLKRVIVKNQITFKAA